MSGAHRGCGGSRWGEPPLARGVRGVAPPPADSPPPAGEGGGAQRRKKWKLLCSALWSGLILGRVLSSNKHDDWRPSRTPRLNHRCNRRQTVLLHINKMLTAAFWLVSQPVVCIKLIRTMPLYNRSIMCTLNHRHCVVNKSGPCVNLFLVQFFT